jgi:small subunit ribosomal protein SAe
MSQVPAALLPREDDIQKMLAAEVHLGTQNLDPKMESYVWKRRQDGFHIIDLGKTWDKLVLAARIIAAIENPADVCVISARTWGQRAVLKFANFTGAVAISGRWLEDTLNPLLISFRSVYSWYLHKSKATERLQGTASFNCY